MQQFIVPKGATSVILPVSIYDSSSTTGAKLTGLVYNTGSLTAYYNRMGAAGSATQITLATATKGTWATGGFIAIDGTNMPGDYELHVPDAALATGVNRVAIQLKGASNMVPVNIEIELTSVNLNDAVRGGMTALPNANADAAGGLPISDAGGLDIDTILGKITGAGVRLDWSAIQNPTSTVALTGTTVDLVANAVDSTSVASSAFTAAKFAAGAIDANALATDAVNEIVAAAKAMVIETNGTVTLGQAMSVILAFAAGVSSGQSTTSPIFEDPSGTTTRITGTTDGSGTRTAVTLNPSA
jgi:hypothetical protein